MVSNEVFFLHQKFDQSKFDESPLIGSKVLQIFNKSIFGFLSFHGFNKYFIRKNKTN